jgi:exopolysaccharide biosynthesis polyprenyl glycosylphosphotransferase
MTDRDRVLTERLIERYESMGSSTSRARWRMCSVWKRLSWKAVVASSLFLKRLFDIVASSCFLIFLSPLLAALALLVKLEDGGPVIFAQNRVGKNGRIFKMLKFRSMRVDAEAQLQKLLAQNAHGKGVTFKMKNDPRVTRIGRILRKYSLDELPQFVNVFKGEMSMVGPRPPVPREVALYTIRDRQRLAVTPGLTCFWQIGGRANIDFPEQVQLDVQYIESQSFWLDVWICLKTVPAIILGRGAC